MANIATVQVWARCRGLDPEELMGVALDAEASYNVPTWHDHGAEHVSLQFGSRWGPGSTPEDLWAFAAGRMDELWIRWYDDGGDHDQLFVVLGAEGERFNLDCRYRYDRILARPRAGVADGACPLGWCTTPEGWSRDGGGEYRMGNDRSPLAADSFAESPTTPSPFRAVSALMHSLDEWTDSEVIQHVLQAGEHCDEILFSFRGRTVRHVSRKDGQWHAAALDHWDNCEEFLSNSGGAAGRSP